MVASSLLAKNGINLMRTVRLELLERTHREVGALLLDDLYEERIELAGVEQQVEVGVHRGPSRSSVRDSTADFDPAAYVTSQAPAPSPAVDQLI
jgi:hypothetical protein